MGCEMFTFCALFTQQRPFFMSRRTFPARNVGRGGGGRGKGHQHHSQHGRGQWPRLPGHRKKHATADTDKSSDIIVQFQQHARFITIMAIALTVLRH